MSGLLFQTSMHMSYKSTKIQPVDGSSDPASADAELTNPTFLSSNASRNVSCDSPSKRTMGALHAISAVFLLPAMQADTNRERPPIIPNARLFKAPSIKPDADTIHGFINGGTEVPIANTRQHPHPAQSNMGSNGDLILQVGDTKPPTEVGGVGGGGAQKGEPTRVYIKLDFVKISDIDTKSQKFIAEVAVRQRWTHPSVANMTPLDFAQLPPQQRWDPKLYISNLEDKKSDEVVWSLDVSSGVPTVYLFRRLKGTFFENMELMDFPNDVQDISVTFISEKPSSEVLLCPDEELGIIDIETFQDSQEWHLYQHVKLKHNVILSRQSQIMQSTLTATAQVSRKMKFFVYNAYLVMFFITGLSFTGFCIDPIDVKFRIGGTLTLLLTSVAFKIAVSNTLPTISYLTKLDTYVLAGVSYLSGKTALFAFISIWKNDEDTAKTIDTCLLIGLGIAQGLWQTMYMFVFYWTTFRKKQETLRAEHAYLKDLQAQRNAHAQKVAIL
ncbi:gamma-aminobutyric acid receptor subunit pi-like isoform X4 [Symsagittifera roscoffensis]|uniref:gamma-aminobutyric acid receptor subunit pi-like isoform X4 n=1 Tax=Symsagittifera roscoffensis TaxID=84072 RepID=UPI00307BADE4